MAKASIHPTECLTLTAAAAVFLLLSVVMCAHDMGPHLKLRDEGLTVVGEKGYRMIRATHGINEGAIY